MLPAIQWSLPLPLLHVDWGWSYFFDDYTNFNGGQSDLQRRSTNLRFWNLTLVLQLTRRKSIFLVVSLWEVSSATDKSTELETTSNIDFLIVNCSTNVKFQNLKFVERLWRSDCPPLRFEKIIDLLFSSVLPHGVSWYDACEVSPPVVVVSGRCWWSAVRVVAHAVVVERRSVPISKDWGWWKQF